MGKLQKFLFLFSLLLATLFSLPAGAAGPLKILAFGDSLVSGYGLEQPRFGFTAELERRLRAAGHDVAVLNGGVAGNTTADGLRRFSQVTEFPPDLLILALGANDMMRRKDIGEISENLETMLKRALALDIPVLLVGVRAPPFLGGPVYAWRFNRIHKKLAEKYEVEFYPDFLEGVSGVGEYNQMDTIHPNAAGVQIMVKNMLPQVERMLRKVQSRQGR